MKIDAELLDTKTGVKYPCPGCNSRKRECSNGCYEWKKWFYIRWREVTSTLRHEKAEIYIPDAEAFANKKIGGV